MNKTLFTILGFVFFAVGFLSIVLNFVGVELSYLLWLKNWLGPLGAFVTKLCFIIFGIIMFIAAQTNFGRENPEV